MLSVPVRPRGHRCLTWQVYAEAIKDLKMVGIDTDEEDEEEDEAPKAASGLYASVWVVGERMWRQLYAASVGERMRRLLFGISPPPPS